MADILARDLLFTTDAIFGDGWTVTPDPAPRSTTRATARRAFRRELPHRYGKIKAHDFVVRVADALQPGISVLDAGSGCVPAYRWFKPAATRADLPADIEYVGLDLSESELVAAGPDAYDERIVGDLCVPRPDLEERFDLIVSHQVLEHVASLPDALETFRRALKPGGRMVSIFSSKNAWFSRADKLVPFKVKTAAMDRLLGRDPDSVFPAHFDHCSHDELQTLLAPWATADIVPAYLGADYTHFSRALTAFYLLYEEWTINAGHPNLATHYVVDAVR